MQTNMIKNKQSAAIPVDNTFDVDDFVGQQGNCYDPNQSFELSSSVAASFLSNGKILIICLVKTFMRLLKPKAQKFSKN